MSQIVMWMGYLVIVVSCTLVAAGMLIGCALLCNRAVWAIVESYGGIKVFNEFREWHHEHKAMGKEAGK